MLDWLRFVAPAQNLGLLSAYVATLALLGMGAIFGLTRGGNALAAATVTPTAEIRVPVIDARPPRQTKTATFSLG